MVGRQTSLSFLIITLASAPSLATDDITVIQSGDPTPAPAEPSLVNLRPIYFFPETNWIDQVTMRELPEGSLHVRYDGPPKLVLKILRGQVRRFARLYCDHTEDPNKLTLDIDGGPLRPWWTRSWLDSLPGEMGGAPVEPYVHTYGKEIRWHIGPFIISNTFKFKLRHVSAVEFDADPQSPVERYDPEKPPKTEPVAIRLEPDAESSAGPNVRFKVRPSINISFPKEDEGWLSFLRNVSLLASVDIYARGRPFAQIEAEAGYSPEDGFSLKIGVTLGIW